MGGRRRHFHIARPKSSPVRRGTFYPSVLKVARSRGLDPRSLEGCPSELARTRSSTTCHSHSSRVLCGRGRRTPCPDFRLPIYLAINTHSRPVHRLPHEKPPASTRSPMHLPLRRLPPRLARAAYEGMPHQSSSSPASRATNYGNSTSDGSTTRRISQLSGHIRPFSSQVRAPIDSDPREVDRRRAYQTNLRSSRHLAPPPCPSSPNTPRCSSPGRSSWTMPCSSP